MPIFFVFGGTANRTLPLPLPNNTSLIGVTGHWQAAVADPVTGFLLTSNALTTRLGL